VEIVNRHLGLGKIIARYGGDEFIIFLDVQSRTETEGKISQIIQGLDAFNHSENHPYELYFTYGYELFYLNTDNSFAECIRCVDEFIYKAKR
jgi:GGDEF domain-containing protein